MGGKAMRFFIQAAVSLLLLAVFFLFLPSFASAQDEEDQQDTNRNRGALYYLGKEDELLIRVNIWGFVLKPGQYMVPKDTDLISLISFAGGPLEQAKMKTVKIIRNAVPVSMTSSFGIHHDANGRNDASEFLLASRNGNLVATERAAQAEQVIKVNVKKFLATGQQSLIPQLQPGDTIVVPGSATHFLGKSLDFVAKFAVIAQIYFWVNLASR
jgi:hypothetical protein